MKTSITPYHIALLVIVGALGFLAGQRFGLESDSTLKHSTKQKSKGDTMTSPLAQNHPPTRPQRANTGHRVKSAQEAMALADRSQRFRALGDYYSGLALSQFTEELDKIGEWPEGDRLKAAELLFTHWGETDPTAALKQIETMGFEGSFMFESVMRSWAAKRPQEAAAYYSSNAKNSQIGGMNANRSRKILEMIAGEWAQSDLAGATAWAQSLEGYAREDAMRAISSQTNK